MSSRNILALEFSTDHRSVAVVRDGLVLAESIQESGRSTRVFSLIADALKQAGIAPADVGVLALGIGPGSYTGIRLAISVAQGWSLAGEGGGQGDQPIEIRTVSSFELMAETIAGSAWLAADAQRDEWAIARVETGQLMTAARLISTAELVSLAATERVVGPEVFQRLGVGQRAYPEAVALGLLAQSRGQVTIPEALEAVYLRAANFLKAPASRSLPGFTS